VARRFCLWRLAISADAHNQAESGHCHVDGSACSDQILPVGERKGPIVHAKALRVFPLLSNLLDRGVRSFAILKRKTNVPKVAFHTSPRHHEFHFAGPSVMVWCKTKQIQQTQQNWTVLKCELGGLLSVEKARRHASPRTARLRFIFHPWINDETFFCPWMKDETMHALILFGVGGGEKPGANNSIFCKLSVGDASGETKAMKIKEEANIKLVYQAATR
jgi:hypothetical protein